MAVVPFLERFGTEVDGSLVIRATDQQILNAANTIGLFASAFITGWISDRIGRKNTIMIGCAGCIGGIVWQYFSTSIMMLWGGKLLATLGLGLGHSLGPVFVAELAPTKMRGICLTLVVSFLPFPNAPKTPRSPLLPPGRVDKLAYTSTPPPRTP